MSESNSYSAFFVLISAFVVLFLIVMGFMLLGLLNGLFAKYVHIPYQTSFLNNLNFILYILMFSVLGILFLLIAFAIQRKD